MKRIARFEKVSRDIFEKAFISCLADREYSDEIYDTVVMPRRATEGSAGYDFHAPVDFTLAPGEMVTIPTGIRAKIADGWVLMIYPRSGLGFKFRLQLNNTVGIIDSDYYNSDNEGHIMIKLTNDSREGKTLSLSKGDAFAQGVFSEFGITEDDCATTKRNGGFGSTDKI
ncbi:MAG TPA: dUTP diphosphatase [Clostridia bacterium]|jgi:dUTP pyrophosphatase|nr:dUTP diphosphatase [Clostridia bacterium]